MEEKKLNKELMCKTLGQGNDKKKYYVYMLCNAKNGMPFYIGKGEGGRIWQHEEGARAKEEEIEEEVKKFEEELNKNSSDEEKDEEKAKKKQQIEDFRSRLENELSEKYKKINSLGRDNVTKVIVKWGLTEKEAYMVESALINMYKFYEGDLTNIVNGHMSKKEKDNRYCKTEAQTIEDFETNCVEPAKTLSEIRDVYRANTDKDIKTADDGCGILFVTINNLYPMCEKAQDKDAAIKDAASAFWSVNKKWLEIVEYVFALYRSKIVGIYPVNKDSWIRKKDLEEINPDTGKAVLNLNGTKKEIQLPLALEDFRKKEYVEIKNQIENGTPENRDRRMFFEADLTSEKDKQRLDELRKFCGKYISLPRDPGAQNSIYYNFETKADKNLAFRESPESEETN